VGRRGARAYRLERFARLREYHTNNPSPATYTAKVSIVLGSGSAIAASSALASEATPAKLKQIVEFIAGKKNLLRRRVGRKRLLQSLPIRRTGTDGTRRTCPTLEH
jgi:hypothetical protein